MAIGTRWLTRRRCSLALAFILLSCSSAPPPPQAPLDRAAASRRSGAAERENVSLTVYNSNLALVREQRRLQLGSGRVALAFEDVSALILPETVHLRSLEAADALAVLEQNYRYDLLTPEALLDAYVGKPVRVARYDEQNGRDEIFDAELLSVQGGAPVLRIGGEVVTGFPGRFILPGVPASLLQRPTLVWLLDSTRPEQRVELSYLTRNLSWHADYVLLLSADDAHADLSGWVTLDNQSGTSFTGAKLQLVAGNVNRVQPPPPPPMPMALAEQSAGNGFGSNFQQEALFEYHLYSLERPADVLDKEQKQVSLLEAAGVELRKKLIIESPEDVTAEWSESVQGEHAQVHVLLDNREDKGLGMPLPAGVLRVYKADQSGAQQFVGEDTIEHTPRDEELEVELGEAFDVVADQRQTSWRVLGKCSSESAYEVVVKNHKDAAAQVEVHETAAGDYQLLESSQPAREQDAERLKFVLDVPAHGSVTLTFRIRTRSC